MCYVRVSWDTARQDSMPGPGRAHTHSGPAARAARGGSRSKSRAAITSVLGHGQAMRTPCRYDGEERRGAMRLRRRDPAWAPGRRCADSERNETRNHTVTHTGYRLTTGVFLYFLLGYGFYNCVHMNESLIIKLCTQTRVCVFCWCQSNHHDVMTHTAKPKKKEHPLVAVKFSFVRF